MASIYLFIDTLSAPQMLVLFSEENGDRKTVDIQSWDGRFKEFELLNDSIYDLLMRNSLDYNILSGMVVITGPGGFTGTRITSLVCNTIQFVHKTPLLGLSFFDALKFSGAPLPYIVEINRREALVYTEEGESILPHQDIPCGAYQGIYFQDSETITVKGLEYERLISVMSLSEMSQSLIEPLYAKDPNITLPKRHGIQ